MNDYKLHAWFGRIPKEPTIYDRFERLVDDAIDICLDNQERFNDYAKSMSASKWNKEFCTVKIDVGRQTGKTQYIMKHFDKGLDIIIVPNYRIKHEYRNIFNTNHVYTIGDIIECKCCKLMKKPRTIWMDEIELNDKRIEFYDIYYELTSEVLKQLFIRFGE